MYVRGREELLLLFATALHFSSIGLKSFFLPFFLFLFSLSFPFDPWRVIKFFLCVFAWAKLLSLRHFLLRKRLFDPFAK